MYFDVKYLFKHLYFYAAILSSFYLMYSVYPLYQCTSYYILLWLFFIRVLTHLLNYLLKNTRITTVPNYFVSRTLQLMHGGEIHNPYPIQAVSLWQSQSCCWDPRHWDDEPEWFHSDIVGNALFWSQKMSALVEHS